MQQHLYFDVLDDKRKQILPRLKSFKSNFYLAGGTALALQLGHRDSIDFDFFTPESFSTEDLFRLTIKTFKNHKVQKTQEEKDTLSVLIDKHTKLSFFCYPYPLNKELVDGDYFKLASVDDVGCMKLSAIVSRATTKDYVDLFFILQEIDLVELLNLTEKMFPELDVNLILKSLVYFEDIEDEPINYKHHKEVEFTKVKSFLIKQVKNLIN